MSKIEALVALALTISACTPPPNPDNNYIPPRPSPTFQPTLIGSPTPDTLATIDARITRIEAGLDILVTRDAIQDATVEAYQNNREALDAQMAMLPQTVIDSAIAILPINDKGYYSSLGSGAFARDLKSGRIGFYTAFHVIWARDTDTRENKFEIFAPQKRARPLVIDAFDIFVDPSFSLNRESNGDSDIAFVVPHDQKALLEFMIEANMHPLEASPREPLPTSSPCYALTFSVYSRSIAYVPRRGSLTLSNEGLLFSSQRGDGLMARGPSGAVMSCMYPEGVLHPVGVLSDLPISPQNSNGTLVTPIPQDLVLLTR